MQRIKGIFIKEWSFTIILLFSCKIWYRISLKITACMPTADDVLLKPFHFIRLFILEFMIIFILLIEIIRFCMIYELLFIWNALLICIASCFFLGTRRRRKTIHCEWRRAWWENLWMRVLVRDKLIHWIMISLWDFIHLFLKRILLFGGVLDGFDSFIA